MTALFAYVEISVVRFANPVFLAFAAIVPVAALYAAVLMARREMALAKMSSDPPRMRFRSLQLMLVSAGLVMAFLAAARPQWGRSEERRTVSSRNLVIAIDVSQSMLARDVGPNRLDRAKADVADLIDSLEGDRCSLVAFRRTGVALCPLTTDRGFLRGTLETLSPDSAPRGETDLGSAIRESLRVISEVDGLAGEKADHSAVIIISDGGDLRGGALEAAQLAKRRGVPIFTVGIGDPKAGSTIPLEGGGILKFDNKPVMVRLEEDALRAIAEASGGKYVPLATARTVDTTLGAIYRNFLRGVAVKEQNEEDDRLAERYLWFIVTALVLLIAGASLSRGRPRSRRLAARRGAAS